MWGQQGVPSPLNTPPPRGESFTWIDNSNALWLFGGVSTGRTSNITDF